MLQTLNRIVLMTVVAMTTASCFAQDHPGADNFARQAAEEHELDEAEVLELLRNARFKQSIVDAISRPAEGKPWYQYRPIFITPERIEGGVAFWRENEERVAAAAEKFGVDAEYIVSIIGVETYYGRITGNYRVLDALATLSFHYPDTGNDRSGFFSSELMNFILLGQEEGLPLQDVTGSYAGAMGLGQFMPSSYRAYAVDLDGDGRRDLWSSLDDVIGSVANYLHVHGWAYGEPVVAPLEAGPEADGSLVARRNFKPAHTVAELSAAGYRTDDVLAADAMGAVVRLDEEEAQSFWLAFNNFYVITRYNRSPLYAMAVHELSQAIREGMGR
ncbi:lytic murein transglycosylase B [Elongatibacter sediminis]|uniref:Lytic murein transglycosylase B n=1 Tax=Elongatibacter sediminis TaxID=3119006 RepID=A0AAW9R5M1_9GAMM